MESIIELLTRTLCDVKPINPTNGAYLYCQTIGNEKSVLQAANFLIRNSLTVKILILQSNAMNGFPGFDDWKKHLSQLGVAEQYIDGVTLNETMMLNTLVESKALIRFAKKQNLPSIFVVAPPFHQLRAFMTAVTVAVKEYPHLKIYNFHGTVLPWQEVVIHSQGTLKNRRNNLIQSEIERIKKYQKKGDLASFETVLKYLNDREETL